MREVEMRRASWVKSWETRGEGVMMTFKTGHRRKFN